MVDEISIQRTLSRCGSIVHIFKIYETINSVKIMLQYINGGTLGNLIRLQRSLSEREIRLLAAQLLLTVDFMEKKRIVHRDLKPENILVHISEAQDEEEHKHSVMDSTPNLGSFTSKSFPS